MEEFGYKWIREGGEGIAATAWNINVVKSVIIALHIYLTSIMALGSLLETHEEFGFQVSSAA